MTEPLGARASAVDVVVKVGGGLLQTPGALEAVTEALGGIEGGPPMLIVPGGGPFADAVRDVARRTTVPEATAHWMAILAMDQYAHLLASRVRGAVLVETEPEIGAAHAGRRLPVLAPYRWLRDADPLPHSWDVSSDSIAAWLAGALRAPRLVLVKPTNIDVADAVDRHFARVLPRGTRVIVLAAAEIRRLDSVVLGGAGH